MKDKSGCMARPGSWYYMKLTEESVRDVNEHRDDGKQSYTRKETFYTDLALKTNNLWQKDPMPSIVEQIGCLPSQNMQ